METFLTAEISARAVARNLALLRGRLVKGTKLCAVVKGDGYGHSLALLGETIFPLVDALAVATGPEALEVRRLGYEGELLMLFAAGPYSAADLAELIASDVTLMVVADAERQRIADVAVEIGRDARVHVKVDTGMTRSGTPANAAAALIRRVRNQRHIALTGLCTHFAVADEPDPSFTRAQLARFLAVVDDAGGRDGLTLHAANSAATIAHPETHLDMVRPGVSVFGYQPADWIADPLPLVPSMRVTAPLMQIKDVPAGARCGYGLTYEFARPGRVGLVPVGYADGYLRTYSNRATMIVAGQSVPVRGRVSMDQTIVELTEVPQARVGDLVEVISNDPAAANCVNRLATLVGTVPQEVTSRLGGRMRKVRVD
jgi:alanine racemase